MKIKISRSIFPNFFTLLNAFSGFLSIIYASKGEYQTSIYLIAFAAIFDALDGMVARLTKSCSEFGVELDSLADSISFGAAPAYLVYKTALFEYGYLGLIISALPLLFGIYRLARFNVDLDNFDKTVFYGLPIPFQAITTAIYIYCFYPFSELHADLLIALILLLCFLMISKIKYPVLPKLTAKNLIKTPILTSYIILSLITVLIWGKLFIFISLITFVIIGIIKAIYFSLFLKTKTQKV